MKKHRMICFVFVMTLFLGAVHASERKKNCNHPLRKSPRLNQPKKEPKEIQKKNKRTFNNSGTASYGVSKRSPKKNKTQEPLLKLEKTVFDETDSIESKIEKWLKDSESCVPLPEIETFINRELEQIRSPGDLPKYIEPKSSSPYSENLLDSQQIDDEMVTRIIVPLKDIDHTAYTEIVQALSFNGYQRFRYHSSRL